MANTYKALSTVTVGAGGAATITFSNIPQTYTDLIVKVSGRGSTAASSLDMQVRVGNGTVDSGSNYNYLEMTGIPSASIVAGGAGSNDKWNTIVNGANATANTFGNVEFYIANYASGNTKSASTDAVTENNSTATQLRLQGWQWTGTTGINIITLTPATGNFEQYSTATLYGVFNADVSSAPATPTIGTATAGSSGDASITFTGVSNAASYTMTSTPDSITGTGTTSPITVTGLVPESSYTFKVKSNNPFGSSAESAASNSITASALSYESIASASPSGVTTVTFSGIPQTYKHLQLRYVARVARTGTSTDGLYTQFNSDSTLANYYAYHYSGGDGTSSIVGNYNSLAGAFIGDASRAGNTSGNFTTYVVDILDYTNTSKYKTISAIGGYEDNANTIGISFFWSSLWKSTSAISSFTIYSVNNTNFSAGSHFALYGIKG